MIEGAYTIRPEREPPSAKGATPRLARDKRDLNEVIPVRVDVFEFVFCVRVRLGGGHYYGLLLAHIESAHIYLIISIIINNQIIILIN